MTFDRRAASKSFLDHMKDAEEAFFKDVLKEMGKTSLRPKVERTNTMTFLTFEGEDRGDLSVDGYVALIVNGHDVTAHFEMKHAMLGVKKDELKLKIGVMTAGTVAQFVLNNALGPR